MLKKLKKLAFSRVFIVGLLIALQFAVILVASIQFRRFFIVYYFVSFILSLTFTLKVLNTNQNIAYKLAWIVVILIFPIFGVAVYTIFCGNMISERQRKKMEMISTLTKPALDDNQDVSAELKKISSIAAKQTAYIKNATLCPPYKNSDTTYFPSGEELFESMISEIEKAEKYIFLEYFIIGYGEMWVKIYDILKRKASEGVDVRVIYDDIGCITKLERDFAVKLEADGIKCKVFHRFIPVLSARQNNRDHRKICAIDGICAFTGGINLADEYINVIERFGYWKDNAVMVKGSAAWSFTVMFLSMWDYLCGKEQKDRGNYDIYRPSASAIESFCGSGFVQPYTDNPLDGEPVGENVYIGMIEGARDYVWITTPYLIIDEQMEQTLCRAVRSGVDVRIVTPAIPDKKIVFETTKSFYPNLIEKGVKIYEYTPGFIHAKTFICDDKYATVGSVNLDYRSLYLHFECGLWMYKTDSIADIKKDMENIFAESKHITESKNSVTRQVFRGVLELLAPLM